VSGAILWAITFISFASAARRPEAMTAHPGIPRVGDRFRIEGGDGDQTILAASLILRLTEADWFSGSIRDPDYGEALLFVVEGGALSGEYIALTSRTTRTLRYQFEMQGWASTVVHRLTKPGQGPSFGRDAVGMAFVERL
jgi:hypothetical protein